jgi:DNA-binding MarR family transcriptional regulator
MRFDRPPPEPLASATPFLLSWNGQRMAARFAATLEPYGLRPPHFGVMRLIATHPGETQHALGQLSLIDPTTMVAVLDELEERGLAERRRNPSDRRKHAVHLTRKGERALVEAGKAAAALGEETLAPLSEREREALRRLLRKLAGLDPVAPA